MQFVEAAGVQTHIDAWGDPNAPGLLLIHGASSDVGLWRPTIAPLLQDRFRLAAYDRPGMGFTEKRPPHAERLAVQAQVAANVIERTGLKRPIVIAHSWGGATALRLALDHPDKVGGLVLIAPVAYEWPGGVSWHIYWSGNPLVGGLFNTVVSRRFAEKAARSGMVAAFAPSLAPEGYFERAFVARAVRPEAMLANAKDLLVAKREIIAQQARYPEIKVPVGILTGVGDSVVSPTIHSLGLSKTLPSVRLYLLDGVGHLPHEAQPAKLVELIDWVRSQQK